MDLIYNNNNIRLTTDGLKNFSDSEESRDSFSTAVSMDYYDNYDNSYFGHQTEDLTNIYCDAKNLRIYSFVILVPGILGTIGNSISALIINRQADGAASVMAQLLKVLAFVDNAYVLLYLLTIHLTYTFYYSDSVDPSSMATLMFTIAAEPMLFTAQMSTVYVTVIIAFMRYIAICKPFKATTLCTKRNAWWAIVTVGTMSIILHIPMFCAYSLQKEDGVWYAIPTKLSDYKSYNLGYRIVFLDILVRGIIPLTALIFFNGRLLMALYKQPKLPCISGPHEGLTLAQQREAKNVTVVIIAIIGVFILSYIPQTVNTIIHEANPQRFQMECGSLDYYLNYVFDALMVLNSCSNFVIYYLLRANFRKRLKLCLFGCCLKETTL